MRRSTVVTLTLLPVLASAAVARADTPPPAPPLVPSSALDAPMFERFSPPGMSEQVLMPPGMTPPVDCEDDDTRPECQPSDGYYYADGGVIRGGFGRYFWISGG